MRLKSLKRRPRPSSLHPLLRRLAAPGVLLREGRSKGKRTGRGLEFTLDISNQELASHVGTVRELVSRNLSRLQVAGLIKLDGRTVIVPDLDALESEVKSEE